MGHIGACTGVCGEDAIQFFTCSFKHGSSKSARSCKAEKVGFRPSREAALTMSSQHFNVAPYAEFLGESPARYHENCIVVFLGLGGGGGRGRARCQPSVTARPRPTSQDENNRSATFMMCLLCFYTARLVRITGPWLMLRTCPRHVMSIWKLTS